VLKGSSSYPERCRPLKAATSCPCWHALRMLPVFSARAKRQRQESHSKTDAPFDVRVSVDVPRPSAILIGKNAQLAPSANGTIRLSNQDELPQDAQLTFSLRAQTPPSFTRDEKIEVATTDGSWSTLLAVGSGGMTLQNSKVAVATLDLRRHSGLRRSDRFGSGWSATVSRRLGPARHAGTSACAQEPRVSGASAEVACKLSASTVPGSDRIRRPHVHSAIQVPDGFPGSALRSRPTEGHSM